jgi:hypothetical protein
MPNHPMISTPIGQCINVKDFGAIGDGYSHPLSQRYSSLSRAQTDYPHATSLAQEIDWAAIQAAIWAVGTAQDPRGAPVLVPRGSYFCSDDLHISRQMVLMGAGRAITRLQFGAGKGIIVHNPRTAPDGSDGTYSTITDLDIVGEKLTVALEQWRAKRRYKVSDKILAPHDNRFYYECLKPGVSSGTTVSWQKCKRYKLHDVIKPAQPILFKCFSTSGSQRSGGTEPIWDLKFDATTKDGLRGEGANVAWQRYVPTTPLAVPPQGWSAQQVYNVGDVIQPTSDFLDSLLFQCVQAGKSGTTEPLWVAPALDDMAGITHDSEVKWQRYPLFPVTPDTATLWKPHTRYQKGALVRSEVFDPANPSNPKKLVIFQCTTSGVSGPGPQEPPWIRTPNTSPEHHGEIAGTFTVDNNIHWTCREAKHYWVADGEVVWACKLAAGIWLRTRAYLHNVLVEGFTCAGVHIQSQPYPLCNVNAWHLDHVPCYSCGVGVAVQGGDSNGGVGVAVEVIAAGYGLPGNGGFGIYDRGASNTWIACLAEVGTGRAYVTTNSSAQSVLLGCYSKGGQPSYLSHSSMAIGGIDAAGFVRNSRGWVVRYGQDVKPFRVNNERGSGVGTHLGINDESNTVFGWEAKDETHGWYLRWYKSEKAWATEWASPLYRAAYLTGGPNDGINGHPRGPGLQGFPSMLLGPVSSPIKIELQATRPQDGKGKPGDIVFNSKPQVGGPQGYIGWVCVGTSLEWKSFGKIEP